MKNAMQFKRLVEKVNNEKQKVSKKLREIIRQNELIYLGETDFDWVKLEAEGHLQYELDNILYSYSSIEEAYNSFSNTLKSTNKSLEWEKEKIRENLKHNEPIDLVVYVYDKLCVEICVEILDFIEAL